MSLLRYPEYKDSGVAWLREVPTHWEVGQSRRLFAQRKERVRPGDEQLTASQKYGVIAQKRFMELEDQRVVQVLLDQDILKHVEPSDFVISMRSFQGGIELCQERGCISSAYVMLIPGSAVQVSYFRYLFKSDAYIQALQSTTNLVRDGQALRFENFALVPLPRLPNEEQTAIAAFLKRETAKIDDLVAEQRRLIELLMEKRQAVISHAVTKGLDPAAPKKPSGIEWLGDVPAHWRVKKLRYLLQKNGLVRGPFGGDLKKEVFTSSGFKVYEQKNAIYGDYHLGASFVSPEKFNEMRRFQTRVGDYLMSCSGTIGRVYRLPDAAPSGIINQALLIIRFSGELESAFADWIFSATFFASQILDNSQGGAMKNLVGMDVFTSVSLPVPPRTEQFEISRYLLTEIGKHDKLIAETNKALGLLQERRAALISAAVTGKVDVRNISATEPEDERELVKA